MTVDKKTDISKAASDTKSIIFNNSECMCSLFEHNLHFMFQLLHTCVGDMAQEGRGLPVQAGSVESLEHI